MSKIQSEKFYTPKQIITLDVMTASTPDTKRQMLLRFIRQGKLNAINLGGDKKPRYVVQGKHLIEYKNAQMKKGEYKTK